MDKLDRSTGGLPPGNPDNPAQLTDRELEVLTLIGRGLSNLEIADALYLSVNTVKTHVRHAYRRTGLTRRTDAVVWVVNHLELRRPVSPA
jgi:DNA-binding NarL/FixJ family response regulator